MEKRQVEGHLRAGRRFALAMKLGFLYAYGRLNDPYELPRTVVLRDVWDAFLALSSPGTRIRPVG